MMRFPSRRSEIKSAFFKMERWREIDGPEIVKHSVISPAESSFFFSSWRIWRRVGSARARKALEADFIYINLAILLNNVKNNYCLCGDGASPVPTRLTLVRGCSW